MLFEKERVSYRVGPLDSGWQRRSVEDADLTFHRQGQGTIGVQATCDEYDDVPAAALVGHLLFGTTHRQYVLEEEVTLDGRGAQHVIVDCELDGVPVRVEIYLLLRNGCVFDLSYVSAPSAPAHAEFTRFAQAFHVERSRRE